MTTQTIPSSTQPITNGPTSNGFSMLSGGMYGYDFTSVLFKHVMDHGWEGLPTMVFLFYAYLSMDKIKDLFK